MNFFKIVALVGTCFAFVPQVFTAQEMISEGQVGDPDQKLPSENVPLATTNQGGAPLAFTLDHGVKVFTLEARPVKWKILSNLTAVVWSYNGMVPGPLIHVTEGDRVRVVLKNRLPVPTTIHWHGIVVPNSMDGVPGMTQDPVASGKDFVYEFQVNQYGTYWYHSHYQSDVQIGVGLYGPLVIDPKKPAANKPDVDLVMMISEWKFLDGDTYPAMPMAGMEANYFTLNGHSYPDTEPIRLKRGQTLRLRLIAAGQLIHPMHIHGPPFQIVATDGHDVPPALQLTKDTVLVGPGERYDLEWKATERGMWMIHCHIPHHTTNAHQEPGGLMATIVVE